jgi:Protein tyrosine and serine/threonine kinase
MDAIRKVLKGHRLEFLDTTPDALVDLFMSCMVEDASERPDFREILEEIESGGETEVIYAALSTFEGQSGGASQAPINLGDFRD